MAETQDSESTTQTQTQGEEENMDYNDELSFSTADTTAAFSTQETATTAARGRRQNNPTTNPTSSTGGSRSNNTNGTPTTSRSTAGRRAGYRPRSKHWCFTMNNYRQIDLDHISSLRSIQGLYLIYGKEVGESGTPHLQGFVSFPSRKYLEQVVNTLGRCHCSIARFLSNSIEYCKKDGDYTEFGIPPKEKTQGQRTDLENFKNDVKNGMVDLTEIREAHSQVYARFRNWVIEYVRDNAPVYKVKSYPLRDWQATLNAKLNLEPDDRQITFLVDLQGNKGKSWFFHYYEQNHEDKVQVILPGKKIDMAFILKENCRVYLFDCPRSKQGEFIQYDFLEEVKNGYVFSGKYEPRNKRFKVPHVVVAMNEYPDMDKLSSDRYDIVVL